MPFDITPCPVMSGRLDSNQRPPEPHEGGLCIKIAETVAVSGFTSLHILHELHQKASLAGFLMQVDATTRRA
jgi:hypothetical protein